MSSTSPFGLAAAQSVSPFGLGPAPSPPFLGLAAAPSVFPFGVGLAAAPAAQAFGGPPSMPQGLNNNEKTLFLFSQAVSNGDISQVQTLLNIAYVRENLHKAVDPFSETPLHIAIRTGNNTIFDALLQSGNIDVNANQLPTYLCAAITYGNYAMIDALIKKGAKLDISDGYGDPLACAVTVPDKQIYDMLVAAGANPGKKYTAHTYDAPDLFTFLLGEAKPLYLAGRQFRDDYVSIAKDIITNYDPDVSDAAFIAEKLAFCDYPELLQALVSKGVDMNPGGIGAQTAVLCCSFDYFKQLQAYGFVDPKQTYAGTTTRGYTFANSTLLHLASSMTRLQDYKQFIDLLTNMAGVDLYAPDSEGFSPLTRTLDTLLNGYYPDRDICEYLISALVKKGVDVKRPDGNGVSPLALVETFPNSDPIKSMIRSAAVGGARRRRKTQRALARRRRSSRRRHN